MLNRRMLVGTALGLFASLMAASGARAAVTLTIGDAQGNPGEIVTVDVTLNITGGEFIGGITNTLNFTNSIFVVDDGGIGLCVVGDDQPRLQIEDYSFKPVLTPPCTPGTNCTGLTAALLPRSSTTPMVQGIAYSCDFQIAANATPGPFVLNSVMATYTDAAGTMNFPIADSFGTITVLGAGPSATPTSGVVDTPTPAATNTTSVPPTNTPAAPATVTRTSAPVNTNTIAVPTRTATSSGPRPTATAVVQAFGDDGCQANPQSGSSGLLVLLLPFAVAQLIRRRQQ